MTVIIFSCVNYMDCHLAGPGETKLFRVLFTINTGQSVSTGYIRFSTDSV